MKNMFSVSKSGEKLIRVVRSVQELASELDETSRAVTDGEYSFFSEIKDMRDRETVLSLTGGDHRGGVREEHPASATEGGPESDESIDEAAGVEADADADQVRPPTEAGGEEPDPVSDAAADDRS
jgi:hypothetical protein